MHFLTGKVVARRTFLRGAGATVALPLLDAMFPAGRVRAGAAAGAGAAAADQPTRLICIEEVHGVAGCNEWGATQHLFAPAAVGRDFELDDANVLKPLEPWRDHMTIVSNTDVRMAEAFEAQEVGGDHFRSSAVFLTQSHPKQTQGSDIFFETDTTRVDSRSSWASPTGRQPAHASNALVPRERGRRIGPGLSSGVAPRGPVLAFEKAILEFNKICQYRTGQVAYFLKRLEETMDGDASLLDRSMIVWGSPMGDANLHNHRRCPLVLMGGANGKLSGGVHLQAESGTPMANVFTSLLHRLGHDDLAGFGDSTGEFSLGADAGP